MKSKNIETKKVRILLYTYFWTDSKNTLLKNLVNLVTEGISFVSYLWAVIDNKRHHHHHYHCHHHRHNHYRHHHLLLLLPLFFILLLTFKWIHIPLRLNHFSLPLVPFVSDEFFFFSFKNIIKRHRCHYLWFLNHRTLCK